MKRENLLNKNKLHFIEYPSAHRNAAGEEINLDKGLPPPRDSVFLEEREQELNDARKVC